MDVSDINSVTETLKKIKENIGNLTGVFHLAGVLKDDLLLNQTADHFSKALAPKLIGSWNLHCATQHLALDYFVLFSSVASTLGSAGQINYAAANGFMNGLALLRRAQGLPAISIAWGPWADAGMAAELTHRLVQQGIAALSAKEGTDYLRIALTRSEPLVTCSKILWDRYSDQYREVPNWLSAFTEKKKVSIDILSQLHYGDRDNNEKILKTFITDTLTHALGFDSDQSIDVEKNFYDLGMDSLMMINACNQLRSGLKNHPDITPELLITNPSIKQLTAALQSSLGMGELPAMKAHIPSASEIMNSPAWVTLLPTHEKPTVRLFCFAHAGGGKSLFADWRTALPDSVGLCLVQLPGREDRIREPMILTQEQIISAIVYHMLPYLEQPYVLVGHSFGALLCYDVMVKLQNLSLPLPRHAFLSSYNPDRKISLNSLLSCLHYPKMNF